MALEAVTNRETTMEAAVTLQDIDRSQDIRRKYREVLRMFEHSRVRTKELHTQALRTERCWKKLGSAERRYIQRHGRMSITDAPSLPAGSITTVSVKNGWCDNCRTHHIPVDVERKEFKYSEICPLELPKESPIMMIGNQGTGVGLRISGHSRRGGGKMRRIHSRNAIIGMTDENLTSKTCVFCYKRLQQAYSRRIKDGKEKLVKVNGAVECTNTKCPSFQHGCSIKGRDANAAVAIALAGLFIHFNEKRQEFPPFTRHSPGVRLGSLTTKNASNSLEANPAYNINTGYNGGPSIEMEDYCK